MNILLTGAFGNVGLYTLKNLLNMGHSLNILELDNKKNRKIHNELKRYYHDQNNKPDIIWGDITDPVTVRSAVRGQDMIVHQAFIIPPLSENRPNWSWDINVGGTRNLLRVAAEMHSVKRFVFVSSVSVFGKTQDLKPPRNTTEDVRPTDNYSHHKVACEQLVKISGMEWTILRLGAVLSPSLYKVDPLLFNIPLNNRIELIHAADAGYAIASAAANDTVWGNIHLIGGGRQCQMLQKDFIARVLDEIGIGMIPEAAFTSRPFYTDWMDTSESQRLLGYQRRDLDDFIEDIRRNLGIRKYLVKMVKPLVKYWLLKKSPYLSDNPENVRKTDRPVEQKPVSVL